jgi:hypothetical protein
MSTTPPGVTPLIANRKTTKNPSSLRDERLKSTSRGATPLEPDTRRDGGERTTPLIQIRTPDALRAAMALYLLPG